VADERGGWWLGGGDNMAGKKSRGSRTRSGSGPPLLLVRYLLEHRPMLGLLSR
jgi:hypothetical protein